MSLNHRGTQRSAEGKYKAYPEYKDSGVEWLGEIPKHWKTKPIKRFSKLYNGSTPKSSEDLYWNGDISWITPADLGKSTTPYIAKGSRNITRMGYETCGATLVPSGSIILASRAPIGTLGIAKKDLCTNQGCKSLVLKKEVYNKFIFYILCVSTKQLNTLGRGTTFLELSVEELGGYETPFPSLPEQKQIAAFLDRETAKIDTLIDKQKKLIALLKEKRQATISHAVTTGLNPNAPMKDSGIPWLGKIPAHWDISQIKYLAYVNDGNHGEEYPKGSDYSDIDNGVPFIRGGNMKELTIDAKEMLYITKEKNESMRKGRLKTGDILFMNRGDIGKLAMIPEAFRDANLNSQIAYIRANSSVIENNFFLYYLASNAVKNLVSSLKMGSVLTQFPIGDLIQIHVPLPPKEEQKKLAEFAANKIAKIDRLISKSEQAIELIQERRTALISAAVTGKIDVGNISVQEYEELNVDGQNYGAS